DLETAGRLRVRVSGRIGPVGHDRRRAGDRDVVPDAHCARVTGGRGHRGNGGNDLAIHALLSIAAWMPFGRSTRGGSTTRRQSWLAAAARSRRTATAGTSS